MDWAANVYTPTSYGKEINQRHVHETANYVFNLLREIYSGGTTERRGVGRLRGVMFKGGKEDEKTHRKHWDSKISPLTLAQPVNLGERHPKSGPKRIST